MSSYTLTTYPVEVLSWMQCKEKEHPVYQSNSPQLSLRGSIVNFVRKICEELKLSLLTTHLAVHLLDCFMDAHDISENQLKLTGLAAILLAAKFEENDSSIPTMTTLNSFANYKYSLSLFVSMESFVLKFFNWSIATVTPAHFAEFFLMYAISPSDTEDGDPLVCPEVVHRKLWISTQLYLDTSLQDIKYLQWRSSQVAAACIACARLQTSLYPTWSPALQLATGYSFKDISDIMETLLSTILESEKQDSLCNTPESGYHSDTSSHRKRR